MNSRIRDHHRWAALKIRARHGWLVVEYSDELGSRTGRLQFLRWDAMNLPSWINTMLAEEFPALSGQYAGLSLPREIGLWLRTGIADFPDTRVHRLSRPVPFHGDELTVPWLLPVTVTPPSKHASWPWELLLKQLLKSVHHTGDRIVMARAHPQRPHDPLRLPVRVGSLGFDHVTLFTGVMNSTWYKSGDGVPEYGLQFQGGAAGADVVFRMPGIPLPARDGSPPSRPRLVVTIANPLQWPWLRQMQTLERGTSHLLLLCQNTEARAVELVQQLILAWVHDFALHELAWILERCVPGCIVSLATDPQANQSLRLSRVMLALYDEAFSGDPARRHALTPLTFVFNHESSGLLPIASFLKSRSTPYSGMPPTSAARRVDVAIAGYNAFGVLAPLAMHERDYPLACGWQYRLRVHIGTPDPRSSLMRGHVPAIDGLLPPFEGASRSIEVVLYVKSFGALSETRATIELAPHGDTRAVYFWVRAPQHAGLADMRLAIYWRNNLLQSFVVRADIAPASGGERYRSETPVEVRLAAAGVADFDALDGVAPRALSVALNEDAAPGQHTLMVKVTGSHGELPLPEAGMQEMMTAYQQVLTLASGDEPPPFADLLRMLAMEGAKIWRMLKLSTGMDGDRLHSLRVSSGKTLQFVRHGGGAPFPWQIAYDYVLPRGPDFASARICLADRPVSPDWVPSNKGCPHCPDSNVICIEGFWSARHRMEMLREEVPADGTPRERLTCAKAPAPNPLIALGIGVKNFQTDSVPERLAKLTAAVPAGLTHLTQASGNILEMLWDQQRRPAMLIVIGHQHAAVPIYNLGVRIAAYPEASDEQMISCDMVAESKKGMGWNAPHTPLVLLLACHSARRAPGELISLVDAFLGTRAAGVAGTEWEIDTELATDFATHLVRSMVADMPPKDLGSTVRAFVHDKLANESIWPFAFSVYGSAELTVGR